MPAYTTSLLFQHPSPKVRRAELRRFLKDLASNVLPGQSVSCLITSDAELLDLNRKFRGKNEATDVLSFPPEDIAISFDRAAAQAFELGHSVEDELRILMLHGLLHLAGMDHHTDHGAMARAEVRWRKRLGLPSGLIERAGASA
ncbi:MAG: rRNA maturation RNase YbeY [Acidobacteriia bacterium]|nr:rRNA maturation RNase YbeY [Terriglobia bacterium]